jgi:hypothetical protein
MTTPIIRATVGKFAPFFKAIAVEGANKEFVTKSLSDY